MIVAAAHAAAAPASDPDSLFSQARNCEEKLYDPVCAATFYERVVHEFPDAAVAIHAKRRAEQLRALLGPHDEYAVQARAFAQAAGHADTDPDAAIHAIDQLATTDWPGAPDALLWLGELLRERGRFDEARVRFEQVQRRWPSSPQGIEALRDAAGTALDAHDWERALALAQELPGGNPVEDAGRAELIASAKRGMRRDTIGVAAWLALALALAVLLASLFDAMFKGGRMWPRLRPPVEVWFLAPIAAVVVAIAFAAQRVIAPAVARITITGVALTWLSGAALDLLRSRGRTTRARSLVHAAACMLGILAIAYVSVVRDGLLDMLVETVKSGPDH